MFVLSLLALLLLTLTGTLYRIRSREESRRRAGELALYERRIERTEQVVRNILQIVEKALEARSPQELCGAVCDHSLMADPTGHHFVLLLDTTKKVPTVSYALDSHDGRVEKLEGEVRTGMLVGSYPQCPVREAACLLRHQMVAINDGEKIVGLLGVSIPPDSTGDELKGPLELLAHVSGLGISRLGSSEASVREAARASQAEWSARRVLHAIEQAAESILITDREGNIEYVNPCLCRTLGYEREELIGRNPRIWKCAESPPALYKELWQTILRGQTWKGVLRNRKKDGSVIQEEAVIHPVRDPSGEITSFVAVKRDVTHERELQEQLLRSQKLEAVGQLAGGVAHDFNNALSTILGYTELARMEFPEEHPVLPYLVEIEKAGRQATGIARQLLMFSRRKPAEKVPVVLNEIVLSLLKMLQRIAGERTRIETDLSTIPCVVQVDIGQIEQVVTNLCLNARDATPAGGRILIRTALATHVDVPPGSIAPLGSGDANAPSTGWVRLTVEDPGTGMKPEVLRNIFQPFFTTKGVGRGSGLGLAIVLGIMRDHGGSIVVQSAEGRGSTFDLYFPLSSMMPRSLIVPERRATIPAARGTVLVVDDDQNVIEVIEKQLSRSGFKVIPAHGPFECIGLLTVDPGCADVLLSDVVMPGMSGPELIARLRKIRPGLRCLLMSGYPDSENEFAGAEAEFGDLLSKPIATDLLVERIQALMKT